MAGHFYRQIYDDSGMCLSDLDDVRLQLMRGLLAYEWYIQWWSYDQGRAYRVLTDVHGGFAPLSYNNMTVSIQY